MSAESQQLVAYINGVRFYPRSCTVTSAVGTVLTFSLDVAPVVEWQILPPRSVCAVFYLDPVTNYFRFVCEGEYDATNSAKLSSGARQRTLSFRGLHAFMDTTSYLTIMGNVPDVAGAAVRAIASNGTDISGANGPVAASLQTIFSDAQNDVASSNAAIYSRWMPLVMQRVAAQTNLEAFYFESRRLARKMYALDDPEIANIVTFARFNDIANNGFSTFGLGSGTKLGHIVRTLESIAFYTHVSVLAPPKYEIGDSDGPDANHQWPVGRASSPDLLFLPQLYDTIPPACNIVFNDQIISLQDGRQWLAMPTRVVVTLQLPTNASQANLPNMYLANGSYDGSAVSAYEYAHPAYHATHGLFSPEELNTGVHAVDHEVTIEKLIGAATQDQFDSYAKVFARHTYEQVRGGYKTMSATCRFLPYMQAGFMAALSNGDNPVLGYVASVTHVMPQAGAFSTTVELIHVRDAYVMTGKNRTPPVPGYLNAAFVGSAVSDTYAHLLGQNKADKPYAAMLPKDKLVTDDSTVTAQAITSGIASSVSVNIDELLSTVVPVPVYGKSSAAMSAPAGMPTTHQEMLQRQFRPGYGIADYAKMNGLSTALTADAASSPPPEIVDNAYPTAIAAPIAMAFTGGVAQSGGLVYGQYELMQRKDSIFTAVTNALAGLAGEAQYLSDERVWAARLIAMAHDAAIMDGTR